MNVRVHTQTTTQRGPLDREMRSAMKDGDISLPEAERLIDLAGTVPSNHAAKVLARAEQNAVGYDTRDMLLSALDNAAAGKFADGLIRDAVADGKVTRQEAQNLVSSVDAAQPAVRARLTALLDTKQLDWRPDAKPAVIDALSGKGAGKPPPVEVFYAVLETKGIAFDDSQGTPRLPVKAVEVKDKHLTGEIRASLQATRQAMGESSEANQIRGPWAIEHDGQRYFGFFHDESQAGRAVLANAQGRVVLDQFVLIDG